MNRNVLSLPLQYISNTVPILDRYCDPNICKTYSDVSSHDRRRHRRRRSDGSSHGNRQYSSKSDGDNFPHSSTRNADRKGIKSLSKHGDDRRSQDKREELAIVLSSDDDKSSTGTQIGSRLLKPSLSDKQEHACISPLGGNDKQITCYQPGEEVESRFGGRSKWFLGRIRQAYESPSVGVVYDIAYNDGDMEEGVLAARVRRPGQKSPEFHAGLQVDIKLGRKGKVKKLQFLPGYSYFTNLIEMSIQPP